MEELLKPENQTYFLFFVVPGIVLMYARSKFLSGRLPPISEGIIAYLVLSLLYQSALFPFSHFTNAKLREYWVLYVFIAPFILGVVLGLVGRTNIIHKIMSGVNMNVAHPIQSAWDWRFSNFSQTFVLVKLKDGTFWRGMVGPNSFISSEPTERDIYIETVYEADKKNNWIERKKGVWIAHGEIQTIEIYK